MILLCILSTFSLRRNIFLMVSKRTMSFIILTNKQRLVQQIFPCLRMESVMSVAINKYCPISSYLTVSKSLIKNQQRNYVLLSLGTEQLKFWSVKYTKMRKKHQHSFFSVTNYNIICCKNTISTLFANGFMNYSPTIYSPAVFIFSSETGSKKRMTWKFSFFLQMHMNNT